MAFNEYAAYYDVLYKDKDYKKESEFVSTKLKKQNPNAQSIVEFGCGTGLHADFLNKEFPTYKGMDLSQGMIETAIKRKERFSSPDTVEFIQGDIRNASFSFKADAVISLFHVISYQTTDEALEESIINAANHLKPGGLLFFDFWYGPAVLAQQPDIRTKVMENKEFKVSRLATPTHDENKQTVNIHFDINIKQKESSEERIIAEDHLMRYFFRPQLEKVLSKYSFDILEHAEFLTDNAPTEDTWGTYLLCRFKG